MLFRVRPHRVAVRLVYFPYAQETCAILTIRSHLLRINITWQSEAQTRGPDEKAHNGILYHLKTAERQREHD